MFLKVEIVRSDEILSDHLTMKELWRIYGLHTKVKHIQSPPRVSSSEETLFHQLLLSLYCDANTLVAVEHETSKFMNTGRSRLFLLLFERTLFGSQIIYITLQIHKQALLL